MVGFLGSRGGIFYQNLIVNLDTYISHKTNIKHESNKDFKRPKA